MGKIRRRFDVQFKTRVCEAVRGGMMTVAEACREYQLSRTAVDRWLVGLGRGVSAAGGEHDPVGQRAVRDLPGLRGRRCAAAIASMLETGVPV